ncbi:hypothetical protein PV327_011297, partial [Microctonus hyperodae]
ALSKSPKLKYLRLDSVPISELFSIGGRKTLKELYIETMDLPCLNFPIGQLGNLETLIIKCKIMSSAEGITDLIINCEKIHTFQFYNWDVLPKYTLNSMLSLRYLRCLHLCTMKNSYESWYEFSDLEEIWIYQREPLLTRRYQIESFLERSKNLKTYSFLNCKQHQNFNDLFDEIVSDIGHKCKRYFAKKGDNFLGSIFY